VEIALTRALGWLCGLVSVALAWELGGELLARLQLGDWGATAEQVVFITVVAAVLYGNLVYHGVRVGYLRRELALVPTADCHERADAQSLAILVPSYCEEPEVVRRTLLSAALQDHPHKRVILLIDDLPNPGDARAKKLLAAMRALPEALEMRLRSPALRIAEAQKEMASRCATGSPDLAREAIALAALYGELSGWVETETLAYPVSDHADRFLVEHVLGRVARDMREEELELERALAAGQRFDVADFERRYRRLAARFDVHLGFFERKRYTNLSHEPNKAMNLNSYIGVMGGRYREVAKSDGLHLERSENGPLWIPDADFLITLDADSVLAPSYAQRLIEILTRPGNERMAIAQTPYSSFPGSPGELERVAGATTDVQYRVHQGLTAYRATFWVGANAVLRKRAVDELRSDRIERGFRVLEFIRDRTVIEDTESSVDLAMRGWFLHNHPERLAWSATPPDFGSLTVQRTRWANGGLLILPKLLRHLLNEFGHKGWLSRVFVQCHYLTSIALMNLALLVLLLHPFEQGMRSLWLPLVALSYFVLYARDLRSEGYRTSDVIRVYALNLLLLPVNLAGVAGSLLQAITGGKTPFGRTPKVADRTAVPAAHLLAHAVLFAACGVRVALDLAAGLWFHATFVAANAVLLAWAFVRYIGVREAFADFAVQLRSGEPTT
jgi:cellulose synthase/poly-beta-1,6-N-acetylglucosamine synthase-like glycosyltransferase